MTLYSVVLYLHSYLRWAVLAGVSLVVVRAFSALYRGKEWTRSDERVHQAAVGLLDLQFTLGLFLYVWLSPITSAFWADIARAMKESVLRFFGLEHATLMLLGVGAVHVGRTRSKQAPTAKLRQRRVAVFTLVGLVLMLAGVPWPFLKSGRPLARGFSATAPAASLVATPGVGECPPAYRSRCAICHGERGGGDGPAAVALNPPPRNFADPVLAGRSDAELLAVIREGGAPHGKSVAMPAHPDLSDADLGALVSCVRSFGALRRP